MSRFLLIFLLVNRALCSEDELFCKDPDTHEYHPINSTWMSTTFCGNYTCKVRSKNKPVTEYIPGLNDKFTREIKTNKLIDKIKESVLKDNNESKDVNCFENNEIGTEDRYLNSQEVSSISKFLYSVKKSDLDKLVEVYNMVNEMYGEMDTSATEEVASKMAKPENVSSVNSEAQQAYSNYQNWYTPQNFPYWQEYYNRYYRILNPDTKPITDYENNFSNQQGPYASTGNQAESKLPIADQNVIKKYNYAPNPYSFPYYPSLVYSPNHVYKNPYPFFQAQLNEHKRTPHTEVIYAVPSQDLAGQNFSYTYPNMAASYDQNAMTKVYDSQTNEKEFYSPPTQNINYASIPAAMDHIDNTEQCPWKTLPFTPNRIEEIRAHYRKTPNLLLNKPKPLLRPGLLNPNRRIRLAKIGKVLRLNELRRKVREADEQIYSTSTETNSYINEGVESTNYPNENENYTTEYVESEETTTATTKYNRKESVESEESKIHFDRKNESLETTTASLDENNFIIKVKDDDNDSIKDIEMTAAATEFEKNERKFIHEERVEIEKVKEEIMAEIKHVEFEIEKLKEKTLIFKKQENETMATYIETIGCKLETEPGYFRAGNTSLPFPHCCPKRIE